MDPLLSQNGQGKKNKKAEAGLNFTGNMKGLNSMLEVFKVKKVERKPVEQRAEEARKEDEKNIEMTQWLGARLPALAFIIILACFTWLYHVSPIVPWLCVFFSLTFAVIVTWPPSMINGKPRELMDWRNMCSWFCHVGLAVSIGLVNYGIIEMWVNTTFLREYSDVKPTADPISLQDGGVLNFASGTKLDVEAAAGYKFWWSRYCAAPVVGADPTAQPVNFWAVGLDCCNSRGGFTCDSADDDNANSAMPLRAHNLPPDIVARYDSAIRMSAAASGLGVGKNKMFVMWQNDPKAMGQKAWWTASIVFLVLCLMAMCVYQCVSSAIFVSEQHHG